MRDQTRDIRVSPEVMDRWWTRDRDGNRLRVDWGEPDADGFYEPAITVDYADNIVAAERARIRAAVEKYIAHHSHEPGKNCVSAFCAAGLHAAILRIIDREDTDATD